MDGELRGERTGREPVRRAARVVARVAAVVALVAGCGPAVMAESHSRPWPASLAQVRTPDRATIVIDGGRPGPVFQGIGAVSGGGGNSRLLIDYPVRERGQILDYLFTPHFGASLQMLKLEIGGGGYSSDGSEPSVEAVQGRLDCGAGYEFWLARQALARNPAIKLYGLQWTAPSWVRDRYGGLWSTADVRYVVDWLRCARGSGLAVSYVGGWNEHYQGTPVQRAWFVDLRRALDSAGFTGTQVVATDQSPQLPEGPGRPLGYFPLVAWRTAADGMAEDPAFARAVSVLGVHDTCGLPTTGYRCVTAAEARTLAARMGKPLWESELGATPSTGADPARPGPGGLARALNDAYNQAGITGILVWPLVDAMPPDLPYENRGLVWADRPWDGSYYVTPLTWVIAQTTQFTAPGWRHVAGANSALPAGGSYDTYEAPGRSAWTLVAQTSVAITAQRVTVHVTGGLPARAVHVWSTNLRGPGPFVRRGDITPHGGTFTTALQPGFVYTFTTTTGQSRADGHPTAVPAAGPMPLPYTAAPDAAGMARMLSPIDGSFGYVHGVLTQTAAGEPVEWHYLGPSPAPYAIVGWNTWRDYTVSARVVLPRSGTASPPPGAALIARFQGLHRTTVSQFRGYELEVRSNGAWQITANGPVPVTLASGTVAAAQAYAMSLTTRGTTISARINGALVATVTNRAYLDGPAGLASLGYYPVQYLRFGVGLAASAKGPERNGRLSPGGSMVTGRLRIGDHERSFTLRKPPTAGAGELPLVIVLHGHSPDASGATMRAWTSFDAHADEWGIAVAYPDGYRGGWADGRGVTAADADGVDDVAFLCALIDWSAERHGTRADHTIIAGVSNGAIMAHRLALQASERVAAFGAVAGALPDALRELQPTHAVSALLINGTADQLVPLGGGYSRHRGPNGELRGRILSQHDTTKHWRAVNRCGSGPDFEIVEETPPSPDRPDWLGLTRHIITGGVGGTKVATLTVRGGGHAWPGSAPVSDPRIAAAIGPIAQNIDAAAEIVRFACPLLDARTRRR